MSSSDYEAFQEWFYYLLDLINDDFEKEVLYESRDTIYNNYVRLSDKSEEEYDGL